MSMTARVALKATTFDPARAALTVLAAPFYVIGLLVGVLWLCVSWVWAAVALGVQDGRAVRGGRES